MNSKRSFRVALIGNMNNNHFAMLRYLLDQGIDAHLFLFNTELDHFLPENDTWHYPKFTNRIHSLESGVPIIDIFKLKFNEFKKFDNYDIVLGCGLSPFYFAVLGRKLDLFIPYGSDLYEIPFRAFPINSLKNIVREIFGYFFLRRFQKKGIKNTRRTIIIDFAKSYSLALNKLGLQSIKLHVPLVYREQDEYEKLPYHIQERLTHLHNNLVIIQHNRQYWHTSLDNAHSEDLKHNNLLIQAVGKLVEYGHKKVRCVFLEYGPDVERSKALIQELELNNYFIWLPKMPRKFLMKVISDYVHLGIDQFGGGYFGGSGYEILACGKPLMNAVSITPEKYKEITGIEFPPIINVRTVEEIANAIAYYIGAPDELAILGLKSKNWFDKNCGTGLIETYIKIFEEIISEKTKELHA